MNEEIALKLWAQLGEEDPWGPKGDLNRPPFFICVRLIPLLYLLLLLLDLYFSTLEKDIYLFAQMWMYQVALREATLSNAFVK